MTRAVPNGDRDVPPRVHAGNGLTETLKPRFVAADHVADGTEAQRQRPASAGRESAKSARQRGWWRPAAGRGGGGADSPRPGTYYGGARGTAQAIRDGWFYTEIFTSMRIDILHRRSQEGYGDQRGVNITRRRLRACCTRIRRCGGGPCRPAGRSGGRNTAAVSLRPGGGFGGRADAHCGRTGGSKPKRVVFCRRLPKNRAQDLKREIRRTPGAVQMNVGAP
jgi:hypothetical protein